MLSILLGPTVLAAGATDQPADWYKVLVRPLSPGSVALLIEHSTDPVVQEHWSRALREPRPEVRAAAARVLNVTGSKALVPNLLAALTAETDPDTAGEEIAALAALGGPAIDVQLLDVAGRGPRLALDVVAALGRSRGRQALAYLPALRSLSLTPGTLVRFFRLACGGEAEVLVSAGATALGAHDAAAWSAVLRTARMEQVPLGERLLISSVTDQPPRLRESSYWHLFLEPGPQPSAALRQALEASPEAGAETADVTAQFAWELVWRKWGRLPREDAAWIARTSGPEPLTIDEELVTRGDVLQALTPSELAALSARLAGGADVLGTRLRELESLKDAARASKDPAAAGRVIGQPQKVGRSVPMRTSDPFPRGFRTDLMAVTGCRGGRGQFGGGRISSGRDGRPREVVFIKPEAPNECAEALRPLALASLITADRLPRPDVPEIVILPLDPQALDCPETEGSEAAGQSRQRTPLDRIFRVGPQDRILEPKKVRHVNPLYPDTARQQRVQGLVVLETTINTSGCVSRIELLQGTDPRLDAAALLAVSGWRYTPTLLNGVPVPVIMTVTVYFRLS